MSKRAVDLLDPGPWWHELRPRRVGRCLCCRKDHIDLNPPSEEWKAKEEHYRQELAHWNSLRAQGFKEWDYQTQLYYQKIDRLVLQEEKDQCIVPDRKVGA